MGGEGRGERRGAVIGIQHGNSRRLSLFARVRVLKRNVPVVL